MTVTAAEGHPVERLPGEAYLRIGGRPEITVMIISARQREREALPERSRVAVPDDRNEKLAVNRLDIAGEIFREADAAALTALHIGFTPIFGAYRDFEVATWKLRERTIHLHRADPCALAIGEGGRVVEDCGDHRRIGLVTERVERGRQRRSCSGSGQCSRIDPRLKRIVTRPVVAPVHTRLEVTRQVDVDARRGIARSHPIGLVEVIVADQPVGPEIEVAEHRTGARRRAEVRVGSGDEDEGLPGQRRLDRILAIRVEHIPPYRDAIRQILLRRDQAAMRAALWQKVDGAARIAGVDARLKVRRSVNRACEQVDVGIGAHRRACIDATLTAEIERAIVAIRAGNVAVLLVLIGEHDGARSPVLTEDRACVQGVVVIRETVTEIGFKPRYALAGDEVDHARDRFGPIDGRGTVGDDFDPLDRQFGDQRIVGIGLLNAAGNKAVPVHQWQGSGCGQAPQTRREGTDSAIADARRGIEAVELRHG